MVFIVALVVTDNIIAILIIFVELIVSRLRSTLLIFLHDIVRIEHRLMLAFHVKAELLLTALICLLSRQLDDRLRELLGLQVLIMAPLLDLIYCRIGSQAKQHMHYLTAQVGPDHSIDPLPSLRLVLLALDLFLGRQKEAGLGNRNLDQLLEEKLDLCCEFLHREVAQAFEH